MATVSWSEMVALARDVKAGRVPSMAQAAAKLASYILAEHEAIERSLAETTLVDVEVDVEDLPSFPAPPARTTLPMIPLEPPSSAPFVAGEIGDDLDEDPP